MRKNTHFNSIGVGVLILGTAFSSVVFADTPETSVLEVQRVEQPLELSDFTREAPRLSRHLARVEGFIQREPSDGRPATQSTEVFAGYDENRIYFIFVARDSEPERIRARMAPRENLSGDDYVSIMLDTFHDRRRAYVFRVNPYGVQWDALWTEGQGLDTSFDAVWDAEGIVTEQGYMVRIAVPFKSLRFPPASRQSWGVIFTRYIPRGQEEQSTWPRVSVRIQGLLNQAGTLRGIDNVSPSQNIQLIPYATFRSFKAVDQNLTSGPDFVTDRSDPNAGLDAKLVFKDSLVTDVTVNPDFSQVESDEPQVTVNQRFEVFFPERRPFFIENADFFRTPINLVFTRRIADPQFGARLTGKAGPYSIGTLLIDDQSQGKIAPEGSPLHGSRAVYGIARLNRDLWDQSTLGVIYVGRELEESYNRVGGLDGRFRFDEHWATSFQAVASSTRLHDGTSLSDSAYALAVSREGRQFNYQGGYTDIGIDFHTKTGFVPRTDYRETSHFMSYFFRPEKTLISWGPEFSVHRSWDQSGTRLDEFAEASLEWTFIGQTEFEVNYRRARERLRPDDFPVLQSDKDFDVDFWNIEYGSSFADAFNFEGDFSWGKLINYNTLPGIEPFSVDGLASDLELSLRPATRLRIDNRYLYYRVSNPTSGEKILSNHILRTRWNWQFNRALSLRVIAQYEATLTDPLQTSVPTRKNLNGDVLVTYRVNPWTALYLGYNGNMQNVELLTTPLGQRFLRRGDRLLNDAYQIFFKFSYLVRF